jgi:hypothetical protein
VKELQTSVPKTIWAAWEDAAMRLAQAVCNKRRVNRRGRCCAFTLSRGSNNIDYLGHTLPPRREILPYSFSSRALTSNHIPILTILINLKADVYNSLSIDRSGIYSALNRAG